MIPTRARDGRGRQLCLQLARQLDPEGLITASGTGEMASRVAELSADDLLRSLARVVRETSHWNADAYDFVPGARVPDSRILVAVAESVWESPATSWWHSAMDRSNQVLVVLDGHRPEFGGRDLSAAMEWEQAMEVSLADQEADPDTRFGLYNSAPTVISTSRGWSAELPAAELVLLESPLPDQRVDCYQVSIQPEARILELISRAQWVDLVERHPRVVTNSRSSYWNARHGIGEPWLLPDWSAVAEDYDGVHLAVSADLETTGLVMECAGGRTCLAAWEPDNTYWLNPRFTLGEHLGGGPLGDFTRWIDRL